MKVIGFNGSPRKDGNTTTLMGYLFREIEKEGIETELVQLSAKAIHGCIACYKCFENQDQRCAVKNDAANEYIEKMTTAQGIVLGSPSYFQDVTAEMKALIDRAGFVGLANGKMYKNKVGASLVLFSSHWRNAYHRNHEPFLLRQRADHRRPGIECCQRQGRGGKR